MTGVGSNYSQWLPTRAKRLRCAAVLLVACLACALWAGDPDSAAASSVPTKVKIHLGSSGGYLTVTAKIRSEKNKCVAPRELRFIREGGQEYYVGSTSTGVWTVFLDEYPAYPPPGSYYVKVPKRIIDGKHHRIRCAADRSNTIQLG